MAKILNGVSAIRINRNSANDFSLKLISGDGSKNVTFIRYGGADADPKIQQVYYKLVELANELGLNV
jgi:hypothetical protein